MREESPWPDLVSVNEVRNAGNNHHDEGSSIIRRIAMDVASGHIVKDANVNQVDGSTFHGPLPLGTENVETRYYYQMEDDDSEMNAVETEGSHCTERLTIGTDCSGMEAPIQALRRMGIVHTHEFSCDSSPQARRTIDTNFPHKVMYIDVVERDNRLTPYTDVSAT